MKFPFFKVRYLPLITEFTELPPTKGRLMLVFMTQFEDDESSYNDARTKLLATFNLNCPMKYIIESFSNGARIYFCKINKNNIEK